MKSIDIIHTTVPVNERDARHRMDKLAQLFAKGARRYLESTVTVDDTQAHPQMTLPK